MPELSDYRELGKRSAAYKAAEFVETGMTVGLGSGSTVYYAVARLGELASEGLKITCVSTSAATTRLALDCGLDLTGLDEITSIDLTIDGADEIDSNLNGIKGGGGALLFEKIVALFSKKNIWIADSSKLVDVLGKFPLPVEVVPFGYKRVFSILELMKLNPVMREKEEAYYLTDSRNFIIDLHAGKISDPEGLDREIKLISGVVETGIFFNIADSAVIADGDAVTILDKH
ncbi:MAG: ribose-5-phosphate isomerase RpiA [Ignavibacteria bacterium]|nr:ribose-5-phosphate isomerase RpiA [Ignavibacteria bacterium]